jgi:glutamate/tyrosine decarboxylase-like PLP-dependent enzyme
VILHRRRENRINHIFVKASWPGYPLVNTAVLSTRSAGSLAASWAVLHYLGEEGYLELSRRILNVKKKLLKSLPEMGLKILGNPESSLLAFSSEDIDVFDIVEEMKNKGWYIQAQPGSKLLGFPKSIHLTISPAHDAVVDEFVEDLKRTVESVQISEKTRSDDDLLTEFSEFASIGFEEVLSKIGIKPGELPDDMRIVNNLIHIMPPEVVEEVFRMAVNEYLFRPSIER